MNVLYNHQSKALLCPSASIWWTFLVWTYKLAVYQRFNRLSSTANVDQSQVRDGLSEIRIPSLFLLHLPQDYVLKIQSNIFTNKPEMEDLYSIPPEDFRGTLDVALHHMCMQELRIQTLLHEPTGPDHQICGLSEPQVSAPFLHFTRPLFTCELLNTQEVLTCRNRGREHECLMLFIEQLDSLESYIFSPNASPWQSAATHGRAGRCRQGWAMWQMHDAVSTGSSASHS